MPPAKKVCGRIRDLMCISGYRGRVRSAVRPSRVRLARRKFTKAAGEEASAMCGTEAAHVNLGDWGRWTWGPALSRPRELQELQWRQGRLILFVRFSCWCSSCVSGTSSALAGDSGGGAFAGQSDCRQHIFGVRGRCPVWNGFVLVLQLCQWHIECAGGRQRRWGVAGQSDCRQHLFGV